MYMNCLVFVDTSHRDNRARSTRDNRRRSGFQVTSSCYVLCFIICYYRCNYLSGVSGIVFAYNVTDEIVPGVFLSRLVGSNRG